MNNNIQKEILNDLISAKQSIKVAVSWLTDIVLINELLKARKKGIDVKIIVSSSMVNIKRFELFQELILNGATVNKEGSQEPDQGSFMHYKFYIVDDRLAKSGSYNWSLNASTNRETIDEVSLQKKLKEFDDCLIGSVNFFHDIVNPEQIKKEIERIENEHNEQLTPEKLAAYRQAQKVMKEQEERHKKEIEKKEQENKAANEKALKEKEELERIIAEKTNKENQTIFHPKTEVKVTQVPPTSYGL